MAIASQSQYPLPDLEFSFLNGLVYHASYNPSKYLKNIVLKPSNFMQDFHPGLDLYDAQKLLRKYYSKKLNNITCFRKDLVQGSKYRFKYLKELKVIGPCRLKASMFPTRSLVVFENGPSAKFKGISTDKFTTACKHLRTLVYEKETSKAFFRGVRKIRKLKALTISVTEEQILNSGDVILSLRDLQKVSLIVKGSKTFKTDKKIEQLAQFFKKLLSLRDLKVFKVNLHDSFLCKDGEFIETLFGYLNQSRLLDFNVQVKLENSGPFEVKKISPLMSKVDFLALNESTKVVNLNGFTAGQLGPAQMNYSEHLSQIIAKSHRVLDIVFADIHESDLMNILSMFQESNNLGNLYVGMKETGTSANILKKFQWVKNLKNMTLDLENLPDRNIRSALLNLTQMVKNTGSIESLTLCDSNPWIYTSVAKNEAIDALAKQIPNIESLKSLRLENLTMNVVSWETTRRMLMSLRNLQEFYFSLRFKHALLPIKFYFPFDELTQLVSLKIKIPSPVELESIEHFVENISKLKNLQVLEIMEKSLEGITFGLVCTLVKSFVWLKKLQEVVVNVGMSSDQINQFVPHHQGNSEEALIKAIRDEIRSLFHSNPKLEKVHFWQENWFDIKYTR